MVEAVGMGTQDILTEGAANFGQWVPSIGIVQAPYIWRSVDHLMAVMNGPNGEQMNQQLINKRGIRILGTTYYGADHDKCDNHRQKDRKGCRHERIQNPQLNMLLPSLLLRMQ
jgi:TRAP-type C4-dicarboxylate transport system substrate-binding protein